MGRLDPKYTDDQREAVGRAMLDHKATARQATTAAAEGRLGLPPFTMPIPTAYDCRRKLERKRTGAEMTDLAKGDLTDAREQLARRAVNLTDRYLTTLEKTQHKPDERRLSVLVRTIKDLPVPRAPAQRDPTKNSQDTKTAELLAAAQTAQETAERQPA